MKRYKVAIHGHIVEARTNEWGAEYVLLNGSLVSRKPYAGFYQANHFFDLEDEQGKTRHIEVSWTDRSKLGLGKYHVQLNVDGVTRCKLKPSDTKKDQDCCTNCGYSLNGLTVDNDEVRCPECGKHTDAALLGEIAQAEGASDSNKKPLGS